MPHSTEPDTAPAESSSHIVFWTALWLSFWALWTLSSVVQAGGELVSSARSAALSMSWGALLGAGVWRLSGHLAWPDRARVKHYLGQAGLAVGYSVAWVALGYLLEWSMSTRPLLVILAESKVLGWQLIMGLWLYGSVAGASHTLRARTRARERERAVAAAERLAVTAQLQALRAQLQPHFLFNALHAVSALIRSDPRTAEDAIERLGELLRYALDAHADDHVPLSQEWHFTRQYLTLESLRLGDRLELHANLAPELLDAVVPSFVLQPLVENAIVHGIAPKRGCSELFVDVNAVPTGDGLRIEVRDTGIGCARDDLQRQGHGLATLRRRLHALYGTAAILQIDAAPGRGCKAMVTLPRSLAATQEDRDEATMHLG